MDFYLDIKINPDADMPTNVLLNKVLTKLHRTLCRLQATDIGVSFPDYKVLLGKRLRIHSSKQRLTELQNIDWLGGLKGYCQLTDILSIPEEVSYRTISRVQQNMTNAKLQRLIRRGTIPSEDIKAYKAKMYAQGLSEAYLELESSSTGQKHRRYISFGELRPTPDKGEFDHFGLSKKATIPWF